MTARRLYLRVCGRGQDGIPQGLKPRFVAGGEKAKAEALAYLPAKTPADPKPQLQAQTHACAGALAFLQTEALLQAKALLRAGVDPWGR